MADTASLCQNCRKTSAQLGANLKQCGKCHVARYCSRECQVAHWPSHKPTCGTDSDPALSPNATLLSGMLHPVENLLHRPPRLTVFEHLIDAYRLRVEDEYAFAGNYIGLYAQEPPLPSFRQYLSLAERRGGSLPSWWDSSARKECEDIATGRKGDSWSQIRYTVEKHDIQEHYGDSMMPMLLRLVAERVYGEPVGA